MAGRVPEWARQDMRKSAGYGCTPGVKQMGNPFHGAKQVRHYADGSEGGVKADEATLKQEGLKASEGEKVGLWERLKAGNIDEPGSEAYNRFGAGRGQRERDYNAAEKQMDQLDAMKKTAEAKPAAPAKVEATRTRTQDEQNDKDTANVRPSKFGDAFAAARKSGAKEFEWNGKKYTTKVKSGADAPATTAAAPTGNLSDDPKRLAEAGRKARQMAADLAEKRKSAK